MARRYADRVVPTLVPVARRALDAAEIGPRDAVLDVGTGTGLVAVLAAERAGPEAMLIGIDRSPEMLAVARERAAAAGYQHVRWLEANAEQMEFADESFDAALCLFDLPTYRRPYDVLKELDRVLAPDARLVLVVWGAAAANEWYGLLRQAIRRAAPGLPWQDPPPFLLSRPGALEVLVQAAEFEEIDSLRIADRMRVPSVAAVWPWVAGLAGIAGPLAGVEPSRLQLLREAVQELAADHVDSQREVVLRREIVYLRAMKRDRLQPRPAPPAAGPSLRRPAVGRGDLCV